MPVQFRVPRKGSPEYRRMVQNVERYIKGDEIRYVSAEAMKQVESKERSMSDELRKMARELAKVADRVVRNFSSDQHKMSLNQADGMLDLRKAAWAVKKRLDELEQEEAVTKPKTLADVSAYVAIEAVGKPNYYYWRDVEGKVMGACHRINLPFTSCYPKDDLMVVKIIGPVRSKVIGTEA